VKITEQKNEETRGGGEEKSSEIEGNSNVSRD
jgi:hypothetical protein